MSAEINRGQPESEGYDAEWLSIAYPNLDTDVTLLSQNDASRTGSFISDTSLELAANLTSIETEVSEAIARGASPDEIDALRARHQQATNRQQVFGDLYSSIRTNLIAMGDEAKIKTDPELYESAVEQACRTTQETIKDWLLGSDEEDSLTAMVYETGMYYRLFEIKSHFLELRNPPLTTAEDFDVMFEGYELPPDYWVTLKLDESFPLLDPNGEAAKLIIATRKASDAALKNRRELEQDVYSSTAEQQTYIFARDKSEYHLERMKILTAMYMHLTSTHEEGAKLRFGDKQLEDSIQMCTIHIQKLMHRYSTTQRNSLKKLARQMELSCLFDRYNDTQTIDETTQPEQ